MFHREGEYPSYLRPQNYPNTKKVFYCHLLNVPNQLQKDQGAWM